MTHNLRILSVFAALAVVAASHAATFSWNGNTATGASLTSSFTTLPPPGSVFSSSPFSTLTSGVISLNTPLNPGTAVFTNGTDTVTVKFDPTQDTVSGNLDALSAMGTITAGTGVFASFVSPTNTLSVTSNTFTNTGLNFFNVIGNVNPVPEPASMAALAIGGLGLVRRRRKV